eukprot:Sro1258_g256760.1 n/a (234) ;mRNA; r:169-872
MQLRDVGTGTNSTGTGSNFTVVTTGRQRIRRRARPEGKRTGTRGETRGRAAAGGVNITKTQKQERRFLRETTRGRRAIKESRENIFAGRNRISAIAVMEKSSAQERQRATDIGTDHSGDHVDEGNSLVTVLTSSDVNNLTSSNTSVSRGHEKGFLQGVLVSLPLASAAAVLGAGGLAAILCITQTICPTTETQQVIEVRTSGDVVFRNLPRPPTQVEIAGVVEQIQNFFEILIA